MGSLKIMWRKSRVISLWETVYEKKKKHEQKEKYRWE